MYGAYLSYSQLLGYLKMLEERNLIVYETEKQLYRVAENGLKFMNAFDKISVLLPSTEERNEATKLEAKTVHPRVDTLRPTK